MEVDFPQDIVTALNCIDERDRPAYIRNAVKTQLVRDGMLGASRTASNQPTETNPIMLILARIAAAKKVPFTEVLDEFNRLKSADLEADSIAIANQMYLTAIS